MRQSRLPRADRQSQSALEIAARLLGRAVTIEDLIAMAKAGDVGCIRLIADTAEIAGRGLGMIGAILQPRPHHLCRPRRPGGVAADRSAHRVLRAAYADQTPRRS